MVDRPILTTGQIAKRWNRSRGYVRSLIKSRKLIPLPEIRDEPKWYIVNLEEVLRFEKLEFEKQKHEDEVRLENLRITYLAKMLGGIDRRYVKPYLEPDEPPDLWQPV